MLVRGEVRSTGLRAAGVIDSRPQVLWLSPGVVHAGAVGNPEVATTEMAWAVGAKVKAQVIAGDSRALSARAC